LAEVDWSELPGEVGALGPDRVVESDRVVALVASERAAALARFHGHGDFALTAAEGSGRGVERLDHRLHLDVLGLDVAFLDVEIERRVGVVGDFRRGESHGSLPWTGASAAGLNDFEDGLRLGAWGA
jgi:hypothetical protein